MCFVCYDFCVFSFVFFFFKQKTAYEMRISDWSSDVCSSDLELDNVFSRNGITRIAAMGLPLDPNKHQAMIEVPSEDAEPGSIVQEMQAGYIDRKSVV